MSLNVMVELDDSVGAFVPSRNDFRGVIGVIRGRFAGLEV